MNIIYPVILKVPEKNPPLAPRERVKFLSSHARKALEISSIKSGYGQFKPLKDKKGVPLPFKKKYWSLTHKPQYVGGVTADFKIGMDIEEIKRIRGCKKALRKKTATEKEWELGHYDNFELFFRYWTAKESVIKAEGSGIRDLLKCRIIELIDDYNLVIHYNKKDWIVEHHFFQGHMASVVKNSCRVKWIKTPGTP
ncbi:MAG TPA: hypothetical protein DD405_05920 [Desulfobacteraceae bacterium]|nr:hypothetical protein [Desulfobacteraceae bacterium]